MNPLRVSVKLWCWRKHKHLLEFRYLLYSRTLFELWRSWGWVCCCGRYLCFFINWVLLKKFGLDLFRGGWNRITKRENILVDFWCSFKLERSDCVFKRVVWSQLFKKIFWWSDWILLNRSMLMGSPDCPLLIWSSFRIYFR